MSECIVTFGSSQHLVGTISTPQQLEHNRVGFILLNAGVISRMGPRRFNVKLARHLGQIGYCSLRFDLTGQGDSGHAAQSSPYEKQTSIDLQAAMDQMTLSTGITRFVIAGICSGAVAGFKVAQDDPRVVGLWMMDGHVYGTVKSRWMRYRMQLRHAFVSTMRSWLRRFWKKATPESKQRSDRLKTDNPSPTREQFAVALQKLVDRNVKILMMYSSDMLWQYSYQNQFRDTFKAYGFVDVIACEYMPQADHTLTTLANQALVMTRIGAWAQVAHPALPDSKV